MINNSKIPPYSYFDYREYLNHVFNALKIKDSKQSLRFIQKELNLPGTAFLSRILDGSRPLSLEYVAVLSRKMGHNSDEALYFKLMVRFGNEKNIDEREEILRLMIKCRSQCAEHEVQDHKLAFFSKWYYPVIRDLVPLLNGDEDYQAIGRMVVPPLKAVQVKSAIKYLLTSGFIQRNEKGNYIVVDPIISTPPRVRSTILRGYHLKNLELNQQAYQLFNSDERSLSSVTCSVSPTSFEKIRIEIEQFRERILAIAREDVEPSIVCHLGLQLMPRARKKRKSQ
jgi:uncharacterized protein (TIGR02147 family)